MRDGTIQKMMGNVANGLADEIARAGYQGAVIRMRIKAYENTIVKPRFGILRALLLSIYAPERLLALVEAEHERLHADYVNAAKVQVEAAQARDKIILPKVAN